MITHFNIVKIFNIKPAFIAVFHFLHIFLKTFERTEVSGINNNSVTDNPDFGIPLKSPVPDKAPCYGPDFCNFIPIISALISGDNIPSMAALISLMAS